jgi:hypothetical protein
MGKASFPFTARKLTHLGPNHKPPLDTKAVLQKLLGSGQFFGEICLHRTTVFATLTAPEMSNACFSYPFRSFASAPLLLGLAMAWSSGSVRAENLALKLDGNGSYVELPTEGYENMTQATVEAWVKWDALRGHSRVFEIGERWRSLAIINHAKKPDLDFFIYPQNAKDDETLRYIISVTNVIRTKEWMHVAAVSGPGGMALYINGWLAGEHTNTASFAAFAQDARFYLGHGLYGFSTDEDFQGEMDEIRIWNYRRTASQIRESMFKRLNGEETGLVHLWNFDNGSARDATAHGKLIGKAVIVPSALDLVREVTPPAPVVAAPTPAVSQPPQVVEVQANGSGAVAWWIAGAISFLALVLAWLAFMFRRSGLGSEKIVGVPLGSAALPAPSSAAIPLTSPGNDALKERALAELTNFAKESLVQGLFSQREALLEAQRRAQQDLVQLEARLANLDLPDRIHAYEVRIAELERQLASRGDEVEGLANVTLQLLRQKLAEERRQASSTPRFN